MGIATKSIITTKYGEHNDSGQYETEVYTYSAFASVPDIVRKMKKNKF